jgi:predicted PurR-regulated permease PerM
MLVLLLVATVGGFLYLASAELNEQAHVVGSRMRDAAHALIGGLPPEWVRVMAPDRAASSVQSSIGTTGLRFFQSLARALAYFALAAILTLYLLIESTLTMAWVLAFVPARRRAQVEATVDECRRVIAAYVVGNVLTSLFAAVFVFAVLTILRVPAALLLALLAGVCDFVPVLGFIVSAVPAVLLSLTVSARVALIVSGCYIAYHAIENYFIGPRVYGDQLRLSNVAVVIAFAIGAEVAGVVGALVALPFAAAYPAIERIWLRPSLGDRVVREHAAIQRQADEGGEPAAPQPSTP